MRKDRQPPPGPAEASELREDCERLRADISELDNGARAAYEVMANCRREAAVSRKILRRLEARLALLRPPPERASVSPERASVSSVLHGETAPPPTTEVKAHDVGVEAGAFYALWHCPQCRAERRSPGYGPDVCPACGGAVNVGRGCYNYFPGQ